MRGHTTLCFLIALLLVSGCTTQYKYGDTTYPTSAAALQAARQDKDWVVGHVTPVQDPVGGRALAIIPTHSFIQAQVAKRFPGAAPEQIAFIVDGMEIQFVGVVEGAQKGKVFDSLTLIRTDSAGSELFDNYDYKFWLYIGGLDAMYWNLSKRGVATAEPVYPDVNAPKADRGNSFNQNMVRAAALLSIN